MNKKKNSLAEEIWHYLRVYRKWWLLPIIIVFVLLGIILIIGQAAPIISPFIYTIF